MNDSPSPSPFNRAVSILVEHGWSWMTKQDAYRVLSDHKVSLISLLQPVGFYLEIAMAEWTKPPRPPVRAAIVLASSPSPTSKSWKWPDIASRCARRWKGKQHDQ